MTDLYDTLGVGKDASDDEIKRAYRKAAMRNHPDREGGDKEKFQQLQRAYDVLGDTERRKRYDETGEERGAEIPRDELIRRKLSELFVMVAAEGIQDPKAQSLTKLMHEVLAIEVENITGTQKSHEKKADKLRTAAARLTRKVGAENFGELALQAQAASEERVVAKIRERLEEIKEMKELLATYEYRTDAREEIVMSFVNPFSGAYSRNP